MIAFLATRCRIPPWLVEVILALVLILAFALYERHQGAMKCVRADEKAANAQVVHNAALQAQGTTTVFQEAYDYHDAILTPVAHPVRLLRVCQPTPGGALPDPAPTGSVRDGSSSLPGPGDRAPVPDEPYGPELQGVGRDADAQIAQLQDYVLKVCRVR